MKQIRTVIKSVLPKAEEELKWSMPDFVQGKIIVMYAGFKNHIGFFPTPSAMKAFKKELLKYKTGKGSIQFPLDQPIPVALVKKIAKYRLNEVTKKNAKWM